MFDALFVWIPKTADTSIFKACENSVGARLYDVKVDRPPFYYERWRLITFQHSGLAALLRAGVIHADEVNRRIVFTVIRNPWERLVSNAAYSARKLAGVTIDREFVKYKNKLSRKRLALPGVPNCRRLNAQCDWLHSNCGRPLVEVVMQFERLDQHWPRFLERAGWPDIALPRLNSAPHDDYRAYYSADMRDLVAKTHAAYIHFGGYRFETAKPSLDTFPP